LTEPRPAADVELLDPTFVARLERLELNVRRLAAGERRGDVPMNRRGPGLLFRGHRPYVVGDDPRFVDWNAFLRSGELVVKEFDAEESARLTLFVDASASMNAGGGIKFDQARRLAAALGFLALARQTPVRLAPLPGPTPDASFQGKARVGALLASLAALKTEPRSGFLRAVRAASPLGRAPGVAVMVSDFYDLDEAAPAVEFLRRRGRQVEAVHLFTPDELDPRMLGPVVLRDLESGRSLRATLKPEMLAEYRDTVERHFADVAACCRAVGAGYHRLDAREPLEHLVLSVLRARSVVK
jgi:uncharacterized protein (DUF58 family)